MTPLFSDASLLTSLREVSALGRSMTVVLRRAGLADRPPQAAYVHPGRDGGTQRRGQGTQAATGAPQLFLAHDADVAVGDRFTLAGAVYVVRWIWPDRAVETICELEVTQ